ncbi:Zn-dependent hydrolase [Ensifer sp. B1-9]|uniref:Zn-dependent hydrolase n=1 Tax=Ensifer sp. B1-9 TaxID=3141455 RepID=UPI003D1B3990
MSVEALRIDPKRINTPATSGDRLWNDIVTTARFGGTDKGGVTRLTLTEEDRQVRDWFVGECRALGCSVEVDGIGNIFATYPGEDMALSAIAVGSHLDTQPQGGRFDGILGVLAGVEILRTLKETSTRLRHPLTVVNWTNEEGSRFSPAMLGSGVFAGALSLDAAHALSDREGATVGAALDAIGYRGRGTLEPTAFAAYVELHIEQGPLLEASATEIGVVTGIQGLRWFDVVITGTEAHAGSTPMAQRDDALVAAAEIVLAVRDIARENPPGVGTVGFVEVGPNSRNVVPGSVRLQIDMRHPSEAGLDQMETALQDAVRKAGANAELRRIWSKAPVAFDPSIVGAVRDSAEALGYSATDVVSGAGHDAAHIATITPTAMIFVPSKDGLSHNEAEYTSPEECARGAEVLFQTILELDRR